MQDHVTHFALIIKRNNEFPIHEALKKLAFNNVR